MTPTMSQTQKLQNEMQWNLFLYRVRDMNHTMFGEDSVQEFPTYLGTERLVNLRETLLKEVEEINEIISMAESAQNSQDILKVFVALADLLVDMNVYCTSESCKWGLPIGLVSKAVMDSQASKLVDGKPVPGDVPGKFGKGPDYQPPEPAIEQLLLDLISQAPGGHIQVLPHRN